jgi:DNA adenine methylase
MSAVPTQARPRVLSPLRFPGAKRLLVPVLQQLVQRPVDLLVEPFCGGASFALACLADGLAERVVLGDADPLVAAFWTAAAYRPDELVSRMRSEPVTLARWDYWRSVDPVGTMDRAVKTLFLNRTSFSGILHGSAGPIGGRAQTGPYPIGCRWAPDEMERRIRWVGELGHSGRIAEVVCGDWRQTLGAWATGSSVLVYADPPYVEKSTVLYGTPFDAAEHEQLAKHLIAAPYRWVLSYDDHPTIRDAYAAEPGLGRYEVSHSYSATGTRKRATRKTELLITDHPVPGCGLGTWGDSA